MSLGASSTKQSQYAGTGISNTGNSLFNQSTGTVTLDPEIERLRNEALKGITGAAGTYGGQISQLQSSAYGNLPDYIQSQINPLQQSLTAQRGQLTSDLSRRGLAGSSFGNQAITNQNIDAQRALQDARAQAIASGVGQVSGLAGQQFGAAQTLSEAQRQQALDRLAQELGLFGLAKKGTSSENSQSLSVNPLDLLFGYKGGIPGAK